MPRYKFTYGGKNYSVDDPAKIDAVIEHLKSQESTMPQEAPGVLDRAEEGALTSMLPGLNTYRTATAHGTGAADIAGAIAGDVGQLGVLGASAASGGVPLALKTLGAGAALGAAQGALQPLIKASGEAGRALGENSIYGRLARRIPENTQSVPLNFIRQVPGAVGETLGELAPSLALAFLGGKVGKTFSTPPKVPIIPRAAADIKSYGGITTPAMEVSGPVGKAVASSAEISSRANPLLMGKYAGIDDANARAIGNMARDLMGPNVLEPGSRVETGQNLQAALKELAQERAKQYKPALERLKTAQDDFFISRKFINNILARVSDLDIAPDHVDAFKTALKETFKPGMNAAQADKAITSLQSRFEKKIGMGSYSPQLQKQINFDFGNMLRATKDAFYEGLDKAQPGNRRTPGLGGLLREAKADYREASQAISPLSKSLSLVIEDPEAAAPKMLSQGSGAVENLLKWADENKPEVSGELRRNLARAILDESGGSAASLKSLLKKYRDIVPSLGASGESLKRISDAMETARSSQLGVVNPPGTGRVVSIGGHLVGAAAAPQAMAWKLATDLGYTYGVPAASRSAQAIRRAAYMPWLKNLGPGYGPAIGMGVVGMQRATDE